MTKIEELEQELEVMEKVTKAYGIFKEEVEQLQKALAELKESKKEGKKEGKWLPKEGDEIWFRNMTGKASYLYYQEGIDIKSNLVFPTKEECERYWRFMDTVKEKSYEFSTDEWRNVNITKWRMGYSFQDGKWEIVPLGGYYIPGAFFFKNSSDAQYIIDNFKDELMEYWL